MGKDVIIDNQPLCCCARRALLSYPHERWACRMSRESAILMNLVDINNANALRIGLLATCSSRYLLSKQHFSHQLYDSRDFAAAWHEI